MSAPPDHWHTLVVGRGAFVTAAGAMDAKNGATYDTEYYASLKTQHAKRRRNLFRLREQESDYGAGAAPLALINQIAEEEKAIRLIESVIGEPTPLSAMDEIGPTAQNMVLYRSINELAAIVKEQAALNTLLREDRQREIDARARSDQEERERRQQLVDARDARRERLLWGIVALVTILLIVIVVRG